MKAADELFARFATRIDNAITEGEVRAAERDFEAEHRALLDVGPLLVQRARRAAQLLGEQALRAGLSASRAGRR